MYTIYKICIYFYVYIRKRGKKGVRHATLNEIEGEESTTDIYIYISFSLVSFRESFPFLSDSFCDVTLITVWVSVTGRL